MAYRSATCPERLAAGAAAVILQRRAGRGFVLASAIFLLVIMASLAAIVVMVSTASQTTSAQDIQGARAYQAAKAGIQAGLYAVQVNGTCPGGTLTGIPGLTGFTVTWTCSSSTFTESAVGHTIYQITSTACTTMGSSCPSSTATEVAGGDYVERQLVAVTEK